MTLLQTVRAFCLQHAVSATGRGTVWIAYSGGLDSHVLLSVCAQLRDDLPITFHVLHVNHGLSPKAKQWAAHCEQVCRQYSMDYHAENLELELANGNSLEEAAREARYAVFAQYVQDNDLLLTAHQQDDQAETLLLQLLRGAGPKGLAGMPNIKPFARGFHGRPLLAFTRTELHHYAKQQQLNWIEDESNLNLEFARNFIRHDILPALNTHWPAAVNTIARSAAHCAEAQSLLDEFAQSILENVRGSRANLLSIKKLSQLNPQQQRLVLRAWLEEQGYRLPDTKKIFGIQQTVLAARADRAPKVCWADTEVRRYQDDLYVLPKLLDHDSGMHFDWDLQHPLLLPGIGMLTATPVLGRGLRADLTQVMVGFRQGGETLFLAGRGSHTLKNLFQEWRIPPWERERIPLILLKDEVIGVAGYALSPEYTVNHDAMGWEIKLNHTPDPARNAG